ncbi:MAG: diguanylate cyclase [Actinobacteria bacterium]|nr:diguanylate cyclase [Actinomycetota bacterium]
MERAEAELLAGRAQAVAKGWLLTLLERAPLDAVAAIPAADLAAEGPAVCAALARALGSDAELDRLRPTGALASLVQRVPALAGAHDAAATLAAVDALRACLWASAVEARGARGDDLAPLAERLAEVALVAGTTALAGAPATGIEGGGEDTAPAAAPQRATADDDRAGGSEDARPPAGRPVGAHPEGHRPQSGWSGPARSSAGPEPEEPAVRDLRAAGGSITHLPQRSAPEPPEMDDGDLWIATLERHVDRAQREGGGLALLRVELVDSERLATAVAIDLSGEGDDRGVPYGRLAQAIRRAIRRQDLVASDRQGRAWVIAPAVGRAGAIALAERIGAGVEHGEHWRGAPLAATIGFAVYGEDGRDAATLIDRAEEAMLAASAAGVRIGEAIPSPVGDADGEGGPGPRLVR